MTASQARIPPEPAPPLDRRVAHLTRLYIVALAAVAILSITGQLLVQQALQRQLSDSTVINIAGRQRMLSQKLTKEALIWNSAATPSERKARAAEMQSTLELWKQSHEGLQRGDRELQLPGRLSPGIARRFGELDPTFVQMATAATELTQTPGEPERQKLLDQLLRLEPVFLAAMDTVVFELDAEAQARVTRLRRIEWALLLLTLLVLSGEGLLIFRPAVQRLQEAAHGLIRSREELRSAKVAAESANEQKTRFLATVSHELRNPLHAILGNTELALQAQPNEEQRARLATIDASAQALLKLVNDLLDLACLQAGQLRIQTQPIDLQQLITRVLHMARPLAERKGLKLSADLPGGHLFAMADPLRIQQVLLNLVGNAVKFTDYGEISLSIRRKEEVAPWRIEVRDTGPGIPPLMQQRIFDAFVQVDASPKREHAGVGLGLAISSGLITLMHGRSGVESTLGAGSCFWIEIPASDEAILQTTTDVEQVPASNSARLRVLIADDDEISRRLLQDYLLNLGHEVQWAANGRQALAMFQSSSWDAVLLDWHMPELDGWELAEQIRAFERRRARKPTPLIAITAAGGVAGSNAPRVSGVTRVLTKPVSLTTLATALTEARRFETRWSKPIARLQGNEELFSVIAELFCEQLPAMLEQLRGAAASDDFTQLAKQAHLLRGQAANFDAAALIAAAESMEEAARAQDGSQCQAVLNQLICAAFDLQEALEPVCRICSRAAVNAPA